MASESMLVAGLAARMHCVLLAMLAATVVAQGAATSAHATVMEQVPHTLRMSVLAWHNASSHKSGGNNDAFRPHEDATILLQQCAMACHSGASCCRIGNRTA
ncbi:hypothetical protein OAO87_01070 [bacterium]|nr:hypothetical protein [bacterium]